MELKFEEIDINPKLCMQNMCMCDSKKLCAKLGLKHDKYTVWECEI